MIAYKLMRKRKDGTLGSLFINCKQRYEIGRLYESESHPTSGYKYRPGFHCCSTPVAPHLSKKGRVWVVVDIPPTSEKISRPAHQGGVWYLAEAMFLLEELNVQDND